MDLISMAGAAVALLAPYLPKLVDSAVEEVGKGIPNTVKKLWKFVFDKFRGNAAAEEALKDAANDPEDKDNIASLRKELRKAMEKDNEFTKAIEAILKEVKPGDHITQSQNITGSVVHGNVQQIGKKES